jgi:HSP20 family protein
MQLVRWEPIRELSAMREVMNRLWDDSYYRPFRLSTVGDEAALPAIDISEKNDKIVVKAVMPGVKPEDLGY